MQEPTISVQNVFQECSCSRLHFAFHVKQPLKIRVHHVHPRRPFFRFPRRVMPGLKSSLSGMAWYFSNKRQARAEIDSNTASAIQSIHAEFEDKKPSFRHNSYEERGFLYLISRCSLTDQDRTPPSQRDQH
eukprot:56856-Rhodomonas_salina.3